MKNQLPPVIEESSVLIQQLNTMHNEARRMQTLSVRVSKDSIEQDKNTLQQEAQELTRLTQLKDEIQDYIADQQWSMEDIEEEISDKNKRSRLLQEKIDQKKVVSQVEALRFAEEKYSDFGEQFHKLTCIHGVKNIDHESDSIINVALVEPYDTIIHVQFDEKAITDVTVS